MSNVLCAFCQQVGERAVEHIWPKWLQIYVGGNTKGTHTGVHVRESHTGLGSHAPLDIISRRRQSGESLVYGEVCRRCNNGWMNALEVSASPILKLLIEGQFETGQWDSQTSAIVARWAFKTALMANGGANYRRLIPPAHFHEFHQTQEVPRHVVVDVALADAPKIELCWGQSQVRGVERLTFDTSFRPEHRANSYNVVLSLKHLLLRVCYWPHDVCVVFPNHDGQFHRIRPYAANVPFNFTKHRTTLEHLIIGRIIYDRI